MGILLLLVLILLLAGVFPRWNYNRNWGYGPSGAVGVILLVILLLVLFENIPYGF